MCGAWVLAPQHSGLGFGAGDGVAVRLQQEGLLGVTATPEGLVWCCAQFAHRPCLVT